MTKRPFESVFAALEEHGLLLVQDAALPSVVGLVVGEKLRTSWWSHPKGRQVFAVLSELADHEEVLRVKLLSGKDTLVHWRLWPALLAVGGAREPWQLTKLPAAAKQLLNKVDRSKQPVRSAGAAAKPLLVRLLVSSHEVHTESGAHALALESWRAWSSRARCRGLASAAAGRAALEEAATSLGAKPDLLPWHGA